MNGNTHTKNAMQISRVGVNLLWEHHDEKYKMNAQSSPPVAVEVEFGPWNIPWTKFLLHFS
jgi:hypothetical protein